MFNDIDVLVLPTAPTTHSIEQVVKDPLTLNNQLGTYTNFVNLLDMCALAVPASVRNDDIPFGITLLAPAGRDAMLASIGRVYQHITGLALGALGVAQPPLARLPAVPKEDEIAIGVVGVHLSGMPLIENCWRLGLATWKPRERRPITGSMR